MRSGAVTAINNNPPQSSAINSNQHTELFEVVLVVVVLVLVLALVLALVPVLAISRHHAVVPVTALALSRRRLAGSKGK